MDKIRLATVFSGIDGFSLAADMIGWETLFTCEIDPFCNKILKHYKPNIPHYGDIKTTDFFIWRGRVDVLAGGFPCQPYSVAGKLLGTADNRHLWPQMLRVIRECSPRWVVGENVRGIISWDEGVVFDEVQSDLEAEGYEVIPFILPACAVNAPHERYRTFFIAHRADSGAESLQLRGENGIHELGTTPDTTSKRGGGFSIGKEEKYAKFTHNCGYGYASDTPSERLQRGNKTTDSRDSEGKSGRFNREYRVPKWDNFPTQSPVRSGNDGFSTELLRRRLRRDSDGVLTEKEIDKIISKSIKEINKEAIKAAGNAVVPPLILQIFKAIEKYEHKI